jgi:ubiquinone/menaquinone biosynthesis C-methylase UbiE
MKIRIIDRIFRIWYWYISKKDKNAEVVFMNYGFSDKDQTIALDKKNEINRYSIQLYHHLASAIDLKNKDIVEIGCGRGGGLAFIASYFSPASAHGIDLINQAITFSKRHYNINDLIFSQGDAQKLSLASDSCDVVINVESSHRYPDMSAFVNEVMRILRPGGYFLITDFRDPKEMKEMKMVLEMSGMPVLNERDITNEVIAALDSDDLRKRNLIKKLAPGFLHKLAHDFAAVKGSNTYNKFASRRFVYFSYVMQKPLLAKPIQVGL